MAWHGDIDLQRDMRQYVTEGFQREEMLDFLTRDHGQYQWSLRSLDRRLRHFDIYYTDKYITADAVREVVTLELDGPGKLLGYRAMYKKVRKDYGLLVTRDAVYNVMYDLNPKGFEERGGVGAKRKKKKASFVSKGPNWVHSLDGHDKLMGYQNSTFPLAVYGCIDTASRKLLWLRVWTTNSDPKLVGLWYLEYLMATGVSPAMIRIDKGTETGTAATIHAFLQRNRRDIADPVDTVLYGPSTSNQIERWWKELHERLEKYFKRHLSLLKELGHYDPHDETDRKLLAYLMIPIMQREVDLFKDTVWNIHRIRCQKNTLLPDGIPDHIYSFPENYGLEQCGIPVSREDLEEAALQSGVLDVAEKDYLDREFRERCCDILPRPEEVMARDCSDTFIHLKRTFSISNSSEN